MPYNLLFGVVRVLNLDIEQTNTKLERIEEGLSYLINLDLLDAFYNEVWRKDTIKLLDKYKDKSSFYDLPLEKPTARYSR